MTNLSVPPQIEIQQAENYSYPLLDVLFESKRLIVATILAFVVMGSMYAFLARPKYQADILVQIEDTPQGALSKGVLGDVSSLFDVQSTGADETLIMQSRLVVETAVEDLKLYIDARPHYLPIIGFWISKFHSDRGHGLSNPGLLGFGGYAWGDESVEMDVFDVPQVYEGDKFKLTVLPGNRFSLTGSDLDDAVEGSIGKEETYRTAAGNMRIKVASVHARPGTTFILYRYSKLDTIQQLQTDLVIQQSDKQSNVISASLQGEDLRQITRIMNAIGEQYVRQNVQRKAAQAAQSLTFLNKQLPTLKQQLQVAEERYTNFRNQHGTIDLSQEALLALQESSQNQAQIVELQAKRGDLLQRYTAEHPGVLGVEQQIRVLQQQNAKIAGRIKGLPDLQQDAVRLMLDVNVDTQLYTTLLNSSQELQLVEAGATGNVRLVDRALAPEVPAKPRKALVVALAALLGVFFAISLAILRDLLFGGIGEASEIERHTGLNVFASIALSKSTPKIDRAVAAARGGSALLAVAAPNDAAIEAMRSLRTALQFAMLDAPNNLIMFAGPTPGVGKSFVASNMAALISMANKRVLLIDGDIRKGRLHDVFGIPRERGFTDVIAGGVSLFEAIHHNVCENVDLLTTGTLPPNPSEVLMSGKLSDVLRSARETYDFVIVDTAPVLAAADTELLARHAGAVMLVTRAGVSKVGEILESVKRLQQVGARVPGVLLNCVNPNRGRYGYGSKYGGYRYFAYNYEPGKNAGKK
ncbi:exopolysaccharide transport protein family [Burkholderia sp. Ch1-1]|nr:exopolysaccharide transport protein family [Burkholderia sp. Ch1-1]